MLYSGEERYADRVIERERVERGGRDWRGSGVERGGEMILEMARCQESLIRSLLSILSHITDMTEYQYIISTIE